MVVVTIGASSGVPALSPSALAPRATLPTGNIPDDLPLPEAEVDPAERIKDMDREGVDVNLTLPSSWFGTFTAGDDIELEMSMYRAYHRWMADYCAPYPACAFNIRG